MEAVYHEEGRLTPQNTNTGTWQYEYTLSDHLGNGRVHFTEDTNNDNSPDILQESDYYPFGGAIQGIHFVQNNSVNAYQYNGKELNDEFGLNWIDYGARWMNPQLGRWWSVDPLAESFYSWSGYNYVFNNPMKFIDPDGKSPSEFEKDETNTWVKTSTKGDNIGVDFYHDGDITNITDRKGNWNTISKGKYLLSGEERGTDVDYKVLTSEFYSGTGPERSVFIGDNNKAKLIDEAKHVYSSYLEFKNSGEDKLLYDTWFGLGILNKLKGDLPNMQVTFMGSFTYSFYKLGDKTLTLVADKKSRTSATPLHLRDSYSRSEGVPNRKSLFSPPPLPRRTQEMTTTHQIYLYFSTYE